MTAVTRVLSGVQPTGSLHVGNYFGALKHWVSAQESSSGSERVETFFCVVDLHALTVEIDPKTLRSNTLATAALLMAIGLDPQRCVIFCQSHVPAHTELSWLMECTITFGELSRMTQFKDKVHNKGAARDSVRAGLFTYPALMAADILAYQSDRVPVGDDQRQHLELARDAAIRFNRRYGETFTVPEAQIPPVAARVMDLQHPETKMSKSAQSPGGTINLLDSPEEIRRKIRRAVTDPGTEVIYDPEHKPGVANLLGLLGAARGMKPQEAASGLSSYAELKQATAEALVEALEPIRKRYEEVSSDPGHLADVLAQGAIKASEVASETVARAKAAIGLLPPAPRRPR
jgi:tryptophanyl-tRNA synthetase